ncbi:MAG: type II CRISPR-associated endonuclease Cas1 [Lachnospiraceae bacterium]
MSWRVVVIESQSKLDYKMGYLVVRSLDTKRILLDEIAVLMIENPAVSLTGILMEELIIRKVKVIFCDTKRNPIAELIPHHGSHDSSAKIRVQITWNQIAKDNIWRDIVSEKIRKQADFLLEIGREEQAMMLSEYTGQIELADATNREGHAAKVYFNALFGMDFTRSADTPINAALNYGYSMILSAFNREVCANGYLTQLGIFHDNMFNHFNLSSDLMEPFRVLVDRMVYQMQPTEFGKEEKHEMWKLLDQKVKIDGQNQFVMNAIKIYTKSVLDAINEGDSSEMKFYNML